MATFRAFLFSMTLIALGGVAAAAQSSLRLRYAARLEQLELLRQRLELEAGGWRLAAFDARRGLKPVYQAAGLDGSWLVAGPVAPKGLLRELANPLGYAPESGVFAERSGLRLETSLDGTNRRGAQFAPLPEHLCLYAVGGRAPPLAFGAVLRLPPGGVLQAEALGHLSLPEPSSVAEEWFAAEPACPGGPLLHLAARVALSPPAKRREAGEPQLNGVAAVCAGPRIRPGVYSRLTAGWESRRAAVKALGGFCSPEYRVPDGSLGDRSAQLACAVRIGSSSGSRIEAAWDRRIGFPVRRSEAGLTVAGAPASERWSLDVRIGRADLRRRRASLEASGELQRRWAADGSVQNGAESELQLRLGSPRREGVMGLRWALRREDGENRISGFLRCRQEGLEVEGGLEIKPASLREARAYGTLQFMGRKDSLYVRVGGTLARPLELILGWSCSQELRKSPTSRISRSRRQP